jgi:hypothetical protein
LTTKTIADANLQKATNEKPLADETCELMKAQFRSRCGRCMELIRSVEALPGTGNGARLAHCVSTHSTRSTQSFNHDARRRRQ